ncbi:MAG: deoxyguanosinetriphosphate triphosphohydrolase [Nocardioidaceae bacterium]
MSEEPLTPGYPAEAGRRRIDEPAKRPGRTAFARDRARVLHAASLRRLSAKTQVVGPGTDDFGRNRLTHSLEVAQVARELGQALGCDPDVVETAALAHDLGHPPFGHNGERALHEASLTCGGFEGNAQTLRILTRLEAKSFAPDGSSVGLNLTRAVLDACVKYPWTRHEAPPPQGLHTDGQDRQVRKFGAYDDDLPAFHWLRERAPAGQRCLEAAVMDLADDVAYSVHDVEDAVVAGRVDLGDLADPDERAGVWSVVRDWYLPQAADDDLVAALASLQQQPGWPTSRFDGTRPALAGLKRLTSGLIGRFCSFAQGATHDKYGPAPLTRYAAGLVVPAPTLVEIAVLKGIAAHYVMRAGDRVDALRDQRALIHSLVTKLAVTAPQHLEPDFTEDFRSAADDSARLRVVIDQVASLTDGSARGWAARLL